MQALSLACIPHFALCLRLVLTIVLLKLADLPLLHGLSPGQILQTMVEIAMDQQVLKLAALTSCDLKCCLAAALPAIMVNQVHVSPSDSDIDQDTDDVLSPDDSIDLLVRSSLLPPQVSGHVICNCPTASENNKSAFVNKTCPYCMHPKA
jgi:hypothetical protein